MEEVVLVEEWVEWVDLADSVEWEDWVDLED